MAIYISILFAIALFCFIVAVFYDYGTNNDKIKNRIKSINPVSKETAEDDDLNKSLSERVFNPMLESIIKFLAKFLPETGFNNQRAEELRKKLRQGGYTLMPSEYTVIRIIVIIGTAVLLFIISLLLKLDNFYVMLAPLFGAYTAFTVMRFALMSRITKRREMMERQLPEVLDMISVNVEAGLGFEQAILHIINHFQGPLIDEFNITYREMTMGRSRRDALILLGERCDIDDMRSFTGAVVQANKLGISLKNVLHTQAAAIRQSRRSKIEEKAHKMSVKILLPMVIFIFPVIFIVLMGPAVLSIMEKFGGM